jgi:prepilin-type N-terminal cleavage/methylation domain-containing protein
MKKQENKLILKAGFTLIELLIVIAIMGILAGVIMVSAGGAKGKANRASAIATLSSVLTELVICQDDGGGINAYPAPYNSTTKICTDATHTEVWPDISRTGWVVTTGSATNNAGIATYEFKADKADQTQIVCKYATSSCD